MSKSMNSPWAPELEQLCQTVRDQVARGNLEACMGPVCRAMERYPHAPQPHNLLGILLEKQGDHRSAMKHFRAAEALDPTYLPAGHNLRTYGTFYSTGRCAFDESDVPPLPECSLDIVRDERGIGRVVYKHRIEYDRQGIGHLVRR